MRRLWIQCWLLSLLLLQACDDETPERHIIYLPADASAGLTYAAEDLKDYLGRMQTGPVTLTTDPAPAACDIGAVQILLQSREALGGNTEPNGNDGFAWTRRPCAGLDIGQRVATWGTTLRGEQYAVYEILHTLGVRFYHPEEEFVPAKAARLGWSAVPATHSRSPLFQRRSFALHLTHPLELLDPVRDGLPEHEPYVKRWIDWNIKNGSTRSATSGPLRPYHRARGFTVGSSINLVETQQGDVPLLNPDDPRSEEEIIAEAIELRMNVPDPPTEFGFNFNPSEFTEEDDVVTVQRMTFIANYMAVRYPDVNLRTINHGTAGPPTATYGVRFYDLPKFAPPNLDVSVHTLMWYDLQRAAPVYGNQNFHGLRDFIFEQSQVRQIEYYPENAWWLTFDNAVPLYFPVTMEARSLDLALLRPLAAQASGERGLVGHHTFTTGQEWGYWQNDWCVARMTLDDSFTYEGCVADIAAHTSAPAVAREAMLRVIDKQVEQLTGTDAEWVRWIVGSDEETEIAFAGGIVFHPLPPGVRSVLSWSALEVERYRANDRQRMLEWEQVFGEQAAALAKALAPDDRIGQEIRDGIEITGLRAAHMRVLMDAVLALWEARQSSDPALVDVAKILHEDAVKLTDAARQVVRRREAMYRYPLAWSIAGDEKNTPGAEKNDTIYTYRYLGRTHRLFYWTRPDALVGALFSSDDVVALSARVLGPDDALSISIADLGSTAVSVDYGDGTVASTLVPHVYANEGVYDVRVSAVGDVTLDSSDKVARVVQPFRVAQGALRVPEPAAASILSSVLPGLSFGFGADTAGAFLALGTDADNDGNADRGALVRVPWDGSATPAADRVMPLVNSSSGAVIGSITLHDAVISVIGAAPAAVEALVFTGELSTDEIIAVLVSIGGFEPVGARKFIASFLGYTEATLPAFVPVRAEGRVAP